MKIAKILILAVSCLFFSCGDKLATFDSYNLTDEEILIYFDFESNKNDDQLIPAAIRSHAGSIPGFTKKWSSNIGVATNQYEVFLVKSYEVLPSPEELEAALEPVIKSLRKSFKFEYKIRRGIDK